MTPPDSGEREVPLSEIPDDPPAGYALHCRDCKSWATIRENAHSHVLKTGHRVPVIGLQPRRIPDRVSLPLALAQRILAALEQEADLDAPFLTAQELQAIAAELRERMPK